MKFFMVLATALSFFAVSLFANEDFSQDRASRYSSKYGFDYYQQLRYCNSLSTNFQRQMCRLGLFANYSIR